MKITKFEKKQAIEYLKKEGINPTHRNIEKFIERNAIVPLYYVNKAWRRGILAGFAFGFILASLIWSII